MSESRSLDFISLQVDYWDNPWQNRHAFLWELSKLYKVFFLSPPFYLVDLLDKFAKNKTRMHGLQLIKQNLYSYVPPRYLPFNYRFTNIDNSVKKIRHQKIKKYLKNLNFEKPVLIIWHPTFADMIDEFGESLVVYYKYDNYSGYIGGSGKADLREKKISKKLDCIGLTEQEVLYKAAKLTYNILEDDEKLRLTPDKFTELRSNYQFRREFGAYKLKLINCNNEIAEKLEMLGFNICN